MCGTKHPAGRRPVGCREPFGEAESSPPAAGASKIFENPAEGRPHDAAKPLINSIKVKFVIIWICLTHVGVAGRKKITHENEYELIYIF